MIVKDEEHIIERCFESVKNIFDRYLICDTGSTDNTKEVIKSWMDRNGKEGEVIFKEWKNFVYNKSYLLDVARKIEKSDYFIWLDADEVWITDSTNPLSYPSIEDRDKLSRFLIDNSASNIINITTYYSGLVYRRPNMCKNNQLYKWEQSVHEYFVATESGNSIDYDGICLLARKEGGSSKDSNRYQKDAQLFLNFLEENPDDSRAVFYLAQSYDSFGSDKSIEWYKKRLELGGFYEERYISALRLGRMLTDFKEKEKYFWLGTEINSERLECYYELVILYTNKGDHRKSAFFGLSAPKNRAVNSNYLFAESIIYDTLFDLNFAVSCYYSNLYKEGYEALQRALLTTKDTGLLDLVKYNINQFRDKMVTYSNPPRQEIIIIDNFYDNPDSVREEALSMDFNVKGNFPGVRTDARIYDGTKEKFESIIGRKIRYWMDSNSYNGSFQYATEEMKSWIHRDLTDWSAIIYLTPNAQADSGTLFYKHKPSGQEYSINPETDGMMNTDTYNSDAWEIVDKIGNKYNRCVLFRGKRTHISDKYFGKDKDDARLFQTFFFDD